MTPHVTIIQTSYNEKKFTMLNLYRWISLYATEFENFDLIITDDGSTDGTAEMVEKIETPFKVQFIRQPDKGFRISRAKNRAIDLAEGDYVYIIDGDHFIGTGTLEEFLRKASVNGHSDSTGFYGPRLPVEEHSFGESNPSVVRKEDFRGNLEDIPPGHYTKFSGTNVFAPTKMMKLVGWAPDDWEGHGYDDYIHVINWQKMGGHYIAVPKAISYMIDEPGTPTDPETTRRFKEFCKKSGVL